MKLETICVQGAYKPKNGEPRVFPIVQSTTYKYDSSQEMGDLFDLKATGYFYSRLQNPTCDNAAAKIAMLEGGVAAMLTGSGQAAAFYSVFNIAQAGDHIVSSSAIYGGTFNLFNVTMRKLGIDFTFVSPHASEDELRAAVKPNTKAFFYKKQVPEFVKRKRLKKIGDLQGDIALFNNMTRIGQVHKVIVDYYDEENKYFVARTEFCSPNVDFCVIIDSGVKVGEFYNVELTDLSELGYKGEVK